MDDLSIYWHGSAQDDLNSSQSAIKRLKRSLFSYPPKKLLSIITVFIIGIGIGWVSHSNEQRSKQLFKIREKIEEKTKLVAACLSNNKDGSQVLGLAERQQNKIKVLSANLIPIWQEDETFNEMINLFPTADATTAALLEPIAEVAEEDAASAVFPILSKPPNSVQEETVQPDYAEDNLAGIRILGEMQNVGQSTVYAANVFVHFYQQVESEKTEPVITGSTNNKKLVGIKVGEWNPQYRFLPLTPGETGVYDIVLFNLPKFAVATIEMKSDPTVNESRVDGESVGVQNKMLRSTTEMSETQQTKDFMFTGTIVNTGDGKIIDPTIYVWLKNREGKVISFVTKTIKPDILLPAQQSVVEFPVTLSISDDMFTYEIKAFGEKM